MRTFASLEIRFEYVLVGKLPNRRIIRRKIRSCDSGIKVSAATFTQDVLKTNANEWPYVWICLGQFSLKHEVTKMFC